MDEGYDCSGFFSWSVEREWRWEEKGTGEGKGRREDLQANYIAIVHLVGCIDRMRFGNLFCRPWDRHGWRDDSGGGKEPPFLCYLFRLPRAKGRGL
jgi:hypothetical protein